MKKVVLNEALFILVLVLSISPAIAFAQNAFGITNTLISLFSQLIILLFVLATVVFLWGIVTYLTAAGDESKIETGRKYIIWGIIALFVMVAVWGLVQILINTFSIGSTGIPETPL